MAVFLLIGELPQGEMTHSRQSYLKFGFSTLSLLHYFWERVYHGLLLLLAAELPHRGDGALKRKLLEFGFFTLSLLVTSF